MLLRVGILYREEIQPMFSKLKWMQWHLYQLALERVPLDVSYETKSGREMQRAVDVAGSFFLEIPLVKM